MSDDVAEKISEEIAGGAAEGLSKGLEEAAANQPRQQPNQDAAAFSAGLQQAMSNRPRQRRPSMKKMLGAAGGGLRAGGRAIISGNTALYLGLFTLLANWLVIGFGLTNFLWLFILQTVYLIFFAFFCRNDSYENGVKIFKIYIIQLCIIFIVSAFGNTYDATYSLVRESIIPFGVSLLLVTGVYVLINQENGWFAALKDHVSIEARIFLVVSIILFATSSAFLAPTIIDALQSFEQLFAGAYALVVLWSGNVWFFWSLSLAKQQGSGLANLVLVATFLLLILSVGASAYQAGIWKNFQSGDYQQDIPGTIQTIYSEGLKGIEIAGQELFKAYNATRSNYTAIVDPNFEQQVEQQSVLKDVGILLEQPYAIQDVFYEGRPIQLFSQLNAVVLEPTLVQTNCTIQARYSNSVPSGNINLQVKEGRIDNSEFLVRQQLPRTIVCEFDDTVGLGGSAKATITATYDWKTSGYTRRYFVSQQLLDNIATRTRDPYSEVYRMFAIPGNERTPASIYTAGPMSLSIGTLGSVVGGQEGGVQGISEEGGDHVELILKFQRKDTVPSQLVDVEYLYFFVPQGFTLKQNGESYECSAAVQEVAQNECVDFCQGDLQCQGECSSYSMYEVIDDIEQNNFILRCVLNTEPAASFLDGNQLSIKSFRASASYTLAASRSLDLLLQKDPDAQNGGTSRFTDKAILSGFSSDVANDFRNNKDEIMNGLQNYQFPEDPEVAALTKGVFAYFYSYHKGDASYCFDGVRYVGISGLSVDEVFDTTVCPEDDNPGIPGNQQISLLATRFEQYATECTSIECQVGKVFCGQSFTFADYSSCSNGVSCDWCHNTLLPGIVTLSQQIYGEEQES